MSLFNLEDQLVFYGSFHHNKWNQLIHIVFVPMIVWSAMVFLILLTPGDAHSLLQLSDKSALATFLPTNGINFSLFAFLLYAVYYLALDFWPAVFYDAFLYVLYLNAHSLVATNENALYIALALHIFSWYMQIHPGHLILEKRRPALTNSFFQSLVLAPIFTFFELLFTLGIRKNLRDRVNRRVVANIKQFKAGVPYEKQKF